MNSIPIPGGRVSSLMMRERLVQQVQADQLALFRVQNQISTGRRLSAPSDDAPAALRAIALQRLLERKGQLQTNVERGLSFLAATDTALNDTAALLGDIRGAALGVAGTTATQQQREAVVTEIDRALETLVQTGNRTFRGRYLFAGSQTHVTPYEFDGRHVVYRGNDKAIQNFADIDVLFASNASGQEVFGGVSSQRLGGVDLNPQVGPDGLLSALNGGRGVSPRGAVSVSDGTNSVVVDLSAAVTLGDVARLLEAHPPAGRQLDVAITSQGLELRLDPGGGGNLTVTEVGSGQTARELGIYEPIGALTGPLVGGDLDPRITRTTPLGNLLGTKARATLVSPGANNDLWLEATTNGAALNGTTVQFVDPARMTAGGGIAAGGEYAQYDAAARSAQASLRFSGVGDDLVLTANTPGTALNGVRIQLVGSPGAAASAAFDGLSQTLTVTVDSLGGTTVEDLRAAIDSEGTFSAAFDASLESAYNPSALISPSDILNVAGDTGNSGGAAGTLYVYVAPGASTANHALAAVNAEGTFSARLDAADSFDVVQAGTGLVGMSATATASGGSGAALDLAGGLRVVNGGQTHALDFAGVETVEDLLNAINGSAAGLLAQISADGRGIDLRSRLSGSDFQIGEQSGELAAQLGLRTFTGATQLAELNYGVGVPTRVGDDFRLIVDDGAGGTTELTFDLSTAKTVQDVLDLVNNHAGNDGVTVDLVARLAGGGGGIEIVDRNGRPLTLRSEFGSQAAEYLGLLAEGETEVVAAGGTVTGEDRNYVENASVFTSLVRLREAVLAGDVPAMERAIELIDDDLDRLTFARAEVGARQQGLDITLQNLQGEDVRLQEALSEEVEVDLVEAISEMTARQAAMQASLQSTAQIMQLTLLDYL